jgi:hypothetical protein
MRLVPEIQTTNLLALTSELFGKSKIINLPEKAEYSFQDTLNVTLYFLNIIRNLGKHRHSLTISYIKW